MKRINIQVLIITSLVVLVLFLSIGFSAFTMKLNINDVIASVREQKDIRITDIQIAEVTNGTVSLYEEYDEDNISLGVNLPNQDSTITYKIVVTNYGNTKMSLDSIIGLPDNLEYTLDNYSLFDAICNVDNQCVLGVSKELLLTIKYKNYDSSNINYSFKLDFDLCEYIKSLYNIVAKTVVSDAGIAFNQKPTDGIYTLSSTEGTANPVYYYRGVVDNNNLVFAGFCWKIVRTTTTGGTKIVYNGVADENNTCLNIGTAHIGTSKFNNSTNSPSYVSYILPKTVSYTYKSKDLSPKTDADGNVIENPTYYYSNDVHWNGTSYELVEPVMSTRDWSNDRTKLANGYHYTCFGETQEVTCEKVKYIHSFGYSSTVYYLELGNGKKLDTAVEEMFKIPDEVIANPTITTYDSAIKTKVDKFYEDNLLTYANYIENTNWCNDRTFTSGSLAGKDVDVVTNSNTFSSHKRTFVIYKPQITCDNPRDDLKVGNGLKYPIGVLTSDEMTMAGYVGINGSSSSSYLNIGTSQWSLSPCIFSGRNAYVTYANSYMDGIYVTYSYAVRPSVSLASGTYVEAEGDGTAENPYIVITE